jgi:hypothetical protein
VCVCVAHDMDMDMAHARRIAGGTRTWSGSAEPSVRAIERPREPSPSSSPVQLAGRLVVFVRISRNAPQSTMPCGAVCLNGAPGESCLQHAPGSCRPVRRGHGFHRGECVHCVSRVRLALILREERGGGQVRRGEMHIMRGVKRSRVKRRGVKRRGIYNERCEEEQGEEEQV